MASLWKKPGFTLVELLVVIVILSVLMALLLPTTKGMLESSKRSRCASNLRAIAGANSQFMAETGTIPRYGLFINGNNVMSWMMALTPYLGYTNGVSVQTNTLAMLRGVAWCPSESRQLIQPNPSTINFSYGWNASIAGPVAGEQPRAAYFTKLSSMFLIGDQKVSVNYRIPPLAWNDSPSNSLFSDRHRGICNLAFVDGHVESRALTNLPYRNNTHSTPAGDKAAFTAFWDGL